MELPGLLRVIGPRTPRTFLPFLPLLTGCATTATTYVHANDTTLGRVVVYRNGIAYFERTADVQGEHLTLKVPAERIDDFLKSLTVVDAKTGRPAPVSYPTSRPTSGTGLVDLNIGLNPAGSHELKLSYVTEAPSWKPSYRVVLGKNGKVELEAWAIVDNSRRAAQAEQGDGRYRPAPRHHPGSRWESTARA
jgi:hypothetical protein